MNRDLSVRPRRSGLAAGTGVLPVVSLLLALAAGPVGCNSSDGVSKPPSEMRTTTPAPVFQADPQLCRDLLDRSIDMLQPRRLGITAERKTAASSLNDWALQCGGVDMESPDQLPEEAAAFVSEDMRGRMDDSHYSSRDCDHLRNALLFREIVDSRATGRATELERVVDLFYHVVRTIQLVEQQPGDLPLTTYEIVLFGRGTAEDRAWVFAELLRQLQIDVCLLSPQGVGKPDKADGGDADARDAAREDADSETSGPETAQTPFLTAVVLDSSLYLFDFRLGMPVPAPGADDKPLFVQTPATLEQAVTDPDVLGRLSSDGGPEYPLDAATLAMPRIELIGNSSLWSPRMKRLQTALSGEDAAVIYDPFWGDGANTGTQARVIAAAKGPWAANDIRLWARPETRLTAFEELDEQRPHELRRWLKAPFPIVRIDPMTGQPQFGVPQNDLVKARIDHVLGELASVIVRYTGLRGLERALVTGVDPQTHKTLVIPEGIREIVRQNVPSQYRDLHREAAENAHYWLGLAQYQQGEYGGAVGTLTTYLDAHGSGAWAPAAHELRAVSQAENGRVAEAVEELRELRRRFPDHPGDAGVELLIRRWEARPANGPQAGAPAAG